MRLQVSKNTKNETKSQIGQYLTPSSIANFMSSLFKPTESDICLLDPGAGIGSLSFAASQNIGAISGSIDTWEIDCNMVKHLKSNLEELSLTTTIHNSDFIQDAVNLVSRGSFTKYTHVIMNPPYKKINGNSIHRKLLRNVGIETVNLYSAFVALSIMLTKPFGQIVAIIPRSFCNGPYYKSFREMILSNCSIEYIHLFDSRNKAFQDDDVLQENIIIKLVKGKSQEQVIISRSYDHNFSNLNQQQIDFTKIIM